jgi:hypothetical protein
MREEIGGALYDEQPEPEILGACCVHPVKSAEDLPNSSPGILGTQLITASS